MPSRRRLDRCKPTKRNSAAAAPPAAAQPTVLDIARSRTKALLEGMIALPDNSPVERIAQLASEALVISSILREQLEVATVAGSTPPQTIGGAIAAVRDLDIQENVLARLRGISVGRAIDKGASATASDSAKDRSKP